MVGAIGGEEAKRSIRQHSQLAPLAYPPLHTPTHGNRLKLFDIPSGS